eukprot:2813897-Rhodomonas_salina.1
MRAKAEADLKSQVDALEERRSKAAEEASRMEQELMQFKKDQVCHSEGERGRGRPLAMSSWRPMRVLSVRYPAVLGCPCVHIWPCADLSQSAASEMGSVVVCPGRCRF